MRMKNFIQSIDYDLWIVTTHGPFVPMTTAGEHQVPTPMEKLTTNGKKKLSLNAKALNVLFCALGQDEFAREMKKGKASITFKRELDKVSIAFKRELDKVFIAFLKDIS
ncbi:unnamed protein product [Cuscuta campestris]|uniref:Uncharacterized protein n=1 Tax=Cuscuta campestris TaxID=132261 RepID=A0A484MEE9_9ASTE|nr:unnamed protein product [Cuscuta campestris]